MTGFGLEPLGEQDGKALFAVHCDLFDEREFGFKDEAGATAKATATAKA